MKAVMVKTKPFDTRKSLKNAGMAKREEPVWVLRSEGKTFRWSNKMERVAVIRKGVPYHAIEVLSERLNRPVKAVLSIVGIPQTTYNKNKSKKLLLDSHDSELVVMITELIDHGLMVFNHEPEKFQRWLNKPNISLGGQTPESLLDTVTGIDEVRFCLNRIESGNFA